MRTGTPIPRFQHAVADMLWVASVGMLISCTTYRYAPSTAASAEPMMGRTVQFAFASGSLTLKVTRVEGMWLFGRVVDGTGPAAILLADVRGARMEDLNEDGHLQELPMNAVRREPSILEGTSVWFETRYGNAVLRQIHVRDDGWIEGHVASNDPDASSIASSTRVKVRTDALVRIDLRQAQTHAVRTIDAGQTVATTTARTLLIVVGVLVGLALLIGTGADSLR